MESKDLHLFLKCCAYKPYSELSLWTLSTALSVFSLTQLKHTVYVAAVPSLFDSKGTGISKEDWFIQKPHYWPLAYWTKRPDSEFWLQRIQYGEFLHSFIETASF